MKLSSIFYALIIWLIPKSLFVDTRVLGASEMYAHFVPVDKSLSSQWVQELFARGERRQYAWQHL